MIINLPATTSGGVGDRLVRLRAEGGAVALGRVLTLVIEAGKDDVEAVIEAANDASREHPCRVLVIDTSSAEPAAGLDAQIRVGGDAGASEVIVLRPSGPARDTLDTLVIPLLLPDAPVVAWWSSSTPAAPSEDPIGTMAGRRITDALSCADPIRTIHALRASYVPGDTDLSWARGTMWRALLASALDEPPYESVTAVTVFGNASRPAPLLLAAWLADSLSCPATVIDESSSQTMTGVQLERRAGPIRLMRRDGSSVATLEQPGQPRQRIVLPLRTLAEALAEELRRLDPDEVYGRALTRGLERVEIR